MNKEDLFESFGALDDALLERSEQGGNAMKKARSMNKLIRTASVAACFLVVLSIGVYLKNSNKTPDVDSDADKNIVVEGDDNISNDTLVETEIVDIGKYSAIYHRAESVEGSKLNERVGSKVEGTQDWYRLSGHKDLQYLIWDKDNAYSLWEFDSFRSENYSYSDVLRKIYNINSSDDIVEIIVAPATMDNTDEGKAIQNEIGTTTITDEEAIKSFYEIVSGLTCYGSNHWDMIGLGDVSSSGMQMQVRAGRYLTLITSHGMELDALKYTGISGMFYEYGGIAYNVLTSDEKVIIEQILNIDY